MTQNTKQQKINKKQIERTAFLALSGILLLFVTILVLGWSKLIMHSVDQFPALSWIIAIIISIIAIWLARAVATEKIRLNYTSTDNIQDDRYTWLVYFIILLTISALGTMNTVFYYGEGRIVLTETIDDTINNIVNLKKEASTLLDDKEFINKQDTINRFIVNLTNEITNASGGLTCGVGANARKIIDEIKKELPEFREISGGNTHACANQENKYQNIADQYKKQANDLLANSNEYTTSKKKREMLKAINNDADNITNELILKKLILQNKLSSLNDAQQLIEHTASMYTTLLSKLESEIKNATKLPRTISIENARQLGTFSQIIPSLLARLDRASTYVYIFAAIFMDIALIMSYMRAIKSSSAPTDGAQTAAGNKNNTRDLKYIWVSPAE